MLASTPSDALRRFAEGRLARGVHFRDVSWPHGEACVWAVVCGGETIAYLKQHRRASKFRSELHAYQHYVPALGEGAPGVLGVHEGESPALLLSALSGSIASDVTLPAELEYQVHVRAARLLKRLHAIPVALSERARVEERMSGWVASWLERADAYFPRATITWAQRETDAGIAEHPPICVCHQDYGPRNWVLSAR